MKRYISLFLFLGCLLISCSTCPRDLSKAHDSISIESLKSHVEYLSDDACSGRLPFTEGADRAVAYLAEQMQNIGLEPIDPESTGLEAYFQQVPLVKVTFEASKTMDISTPNGKLTLLRGEDFTAFNQNMSEEDIIENAELFFAGYGIVAPEYGKNDYEGLTDPSNKVAVVMVNDPGLGTAGSYFTGDAMTYYGRWTYKYEEGFKQGLKGVLIIHETRGAGYPWSTVVASDVKYTIESDSDQTGMPLQGWLSNEAARRLFASCGYDMDSLIESAKQPEFKPFDLVSKVSVSIDKSFEKALSPNVVGYIEGSERPDECVVCSAHWDHLGFSDKPVDGDSIINGATDNATALAWLLETAKAIKSLDYTPRRSIVFFAPTCEEKGMWGTEYYVMNPLFSMENTLAIVNRDVLTLWGENNDVTVTGYGHSDLDSLLEECAAKYGRYVMADPEASNGMFYRSDQLPFMRRGVPAMFAKGWSDNKKMGKEWSISMIEDYWANIYHTVYDQVGPDDDYSGLKQDSDLFLDFIMAIADSDYFPQWYEDSEFQR